MLDKEDIKINLSNSEAVLIKAPNIASKLFKLFNLYTLATDKHIYNVGFFKTHRIPYTGIQSIDIKKGKLYYQLLIKPAKKDKVIKFKSDKKEIFALFNIISNNMMKPKGANEFKNVKINEALDKNKKKNIKGIKQEKIDNFVSNSENVNKKLLLRNSTVYSSQDIKKRDIQNDKNYVYNKYKNILKAEELSRILFPKLQSLQTFMQPIYKKGIIVPINIKNELTKNIGTLKTIDYKTKITELSNVIKKENLKKFNESILLNYNTYIKEIKKLRYYTIDKVFFNNKKFVFIKNNNNFTFIAMPYFNLDNFNMLIFNDVKNSNEDFDNSEIKNKLTMQKKAEQNKNYLYNMHIFNVRRIRENVKKMDFLNDLKINRYEEQMDSNDLWFKIK